jgi:hypothetical protein
MNQRSLILFALVACLYLGTGFLQSWNLSLSILNAALLATIAALGVNMQWGYAGLFSVGTMGFTALGGLAVVLVSARPNVENWQAGGMGILLALILGALSVMAAIFAWRKLPKGRLRALGVAAILIGRGDQPPVRRQPWRAGAAVAGRLAGRGPSGRRRRLGDRQDLAWPTVGLSGHRDPGDRRDHRLGPEERGLAEPRGEEHHRTAAPLAGAL